MVFTLWGENWNKNTSVNWRRSARKHKHAFSRDIYYVEIFVGCALSLPRSPFKSISWKKKLARVIVCANTEIEVSWCRNAKHTRTPPTQYQAQFLADQYQPITSSRFFYAHAPTSNSLFLLPFYVTDGCTRSLCRSAVGSRDHGPGGAEFPSGWHHHCADHDVMWLVVRSSRGSGRLVSCAVCSGE